MKTSLFTTILIFSIFISCDSGNKKPRKFSTILTRQRINTNPHTFETKTENCESFAMIISSNKLAKKLNKSKAWVVANYTIPLQADTVSETDRIIGQVMPGAHCFIIKQEGSWFYVQSPGSNELGWLNKKYVVGFIKKDPETLLPCVG